jgi:hypothetical protein
MRIAWTALSSNHRTEDSFVGSGRGLLARPSRGHQPRSRHPRRHIAVRCLHPPQDSHRSGRKAHREVAPRTLFRSARNCRTDGGEFLLGVGREPAPNRIEPSAPARESHSASRLESSEPPPQPDAASKQPPLNPVRSMASQRSLALQNAPNQSPSPRVPPAPARTALVTQDGPSKHLQEPPVPRTNRDRKGALQASAPPHEKKVMPSKGFFPNLWRRQHDGTGALEKAVRT